ncbi:NAD(P)/FAD-dependent oxidoreductase [Amycolatopsis sp. NPDC059021]|uniref:NAD(P)/FAD-dependent oxidoreductase n=1 Tax=Amycolatopsis sp. NPDC059021 TaxID=3346704 RepID=UPI00366BFF42
MKSVAIVGASLAGARALQELRGQGFEGDVVMVGEEPHRPYDRPPLSKEFLAGTSDRESLDLLDADDELGVTYRLGVRAERLDPANGRLTLSDGEEIFADGVVIATGGRARTLPGAEGIAGVHVLRTLDDALRLRAELAGSPRVVVAGAGFIGAEVASTCRGLGLDVTVLEALDAPLSRVFGPELGAVCARLHAEHGTRLRCRSVVSGLTTVDNGPRGRRVTGVDLADGGHLPADVVVMGIGMSPAADWLIGSGLTIGNGVHTDHGLVTKLPNVVAIGDVAQYAGGEAGQRLRHEHWTNATEQAGVAIANLLAGQTIRGYTASGYVWSDQYGGRIQVAGHPAPGDKLVLVEGTTEDSSFVATFERDGVTVGVFALNNVKLFNRLKRQALRPPAPVA